MKNKNTTESPLWTPPEERVNSSNMTAFISSVNRLLGTSFEKYDDVYRWSVENIEDFWQTVWDYSGIIRSRNFDTVLANSKMPGAQWFEGARLNFAENLLRYRDNHPAIVYWREDGKRLRLRYHELFLHVAACAAGLKELGIKKGDRVAAFVTNIPEAVIAMLAVTSMGAIWASCSPDFGFKGVLDRFGQIEPKVLFSVDGYVYNGKQYDCVEKIEKIVESLPHLSKTVLIPQSNDRRLSDHGMYTYWDDFLSNKEESIAFEQLPFDHPVYIMYSSGTTGMPKCIVHGAGGTLLQHFKELSLHTNLKRGDVIFYYTTCGWMMWNWLVSSLYIGATVFLYDGSPSYPDFGVLWQAVQEEGITVFGTSPKYLTSCQKNGIQPGNGYDLSSLKTVLSTGSPLSDENFNWVYSAVKKDIQLASISGGTDIISCFMLGNPNLPVYSEEIQCRGLGMKVESYDNDCNSVIDEKGELVCTAPFPSMPVYFWNDPDNKKYRSAYFEHFHGIWRHGDYIRITNRGGIIVYGRSDTTLNPGGVRIGTAEIYRIVETMDEVEDSIVAGQSWNDDIRIILFVVLKTGFSLSDGLKDKIVHEIKSGLTPRHVPKIIHQIDEVPTTINGKKVELAVTRILNGEEVTNKEALANPESLKQLEKFSRSFQNDVLAS